MAEGHLCVMCENKRDAEVVFDHDKSVAQLDFPRSGDGSFHDDKSGVDGLLRNDKSGAQRGVNRDKSMMTTS